jgi:hypothetical protein
VPFVRGRHPDGGWIAYEMVPRKPAELATAYIATETFDPIADLDILTSAAPVQRSAVVHAGRIWPLVGITCDRFIDRAHPPYGPNVWSVATPVAPDELVTVVTRLADALGIRERPLVDELAAHAKAWTGTRLRIAIDVAFNCVLPFAWIMVEPIAWNYIYVFVMKVLGPERARRVCDALGPSCTDRAGLAIRLASEPPVRVRIVAPLRDTT